MEIEMESSSMPNRLEEHLPMPDRPILVTKEEMPGGIGYHIFRCGDSFRNEIKRFIPWLLRARKNVLIAEAALSPSLVITIEPLDTILDQEFIAGFGSFLAKV